MAKWLVLQTSDHHIMVSYDLNNVEKERTTPNHHHFSQPKTKDLFYSPVRSAWRAIVVTLVVCVHVLVTLFKVLCSSFSKVPIATTLIRKHSYLDHSYFEGSAFIPYFRSQGPCLGAGLEVKI